eukprot:TRINITY_DN12165_c0_g1_i1.p2 TRINITY_DN12165_c0_g1~~TRINITY_DN12165_c0_g1_i1.p2  ORF type:complete len:121 (-),score=2.37 TRINITY_DN12165_c0_g1_i1:169-531(-)
MTFGRDTTPRGSSGALRLVRQPRRRTAARCGSCVRGSLLASDVTDAHVLRPSGRSPRPVVCGGGGCIDETRDAANIHTPACLQGPRSRQTTAISTRHVITTRGKCYVCPVQQGRGQLNGI